MSDLSKVKALLLEKQKKSEEEIKNLDLEDPVLSDQTPESSEPGTDSWLADVHSRSESAKMTLTTTLKHVKHALHKIETNKYGKCEKCGNPIEAPRLEIMPEAPLCIACSKIK